LPSAIAIGFFLAIFRLDRLTIERPKLFAISQLLTFSYPVSDWSFNRITFFISQVCERITCALTSGLLERPNVGFWAN
jgi:hypothetical protein